MVPYPGRTMSSTRPRTRTRKAPAERAAELIAAAVDLARTEGLAAVTLRAVAQRAGVTPGLVAHYHPSMDELVALVFTTLATAERDEVADLLAAQTGPADRVRTLCATLLDGTREDITVVWVESWALGRRNAALAQAVRDQATAWNGLVCGVLEEGRAAGVLDLAATAVDGAAWQLMGLIDGLNAQSLVRRTDAARFVTETTRAAEALLGAPPGTISG